MNERTLLSAVAGVCFGVWPLVMNRARLDPFAAVIVFLVGSLLFASPAALFGQWGSVTSAQLRVAAIACLVSAAGTISFNRMLSITTPAEAPNLLLVMLVVQVAVPAAMVLRQGASARQLAGVAAAAIAVVLLGKR